MTHNLEALGAAVLEIIMDHQNVGSNWKSQPFVDKAQAFDKICAVANSLLTRNPKNGLLIAKEPFYTKVPCEEMNVTLVAE